ncbi:MAG: L,D-transpeptidase [Candidatus Aminicenantes bacterium]|nr:L,D-transpeptidase [Candidatus Aminicenantes bacterium]
MVKKKSLVIFFIIWGGLFLGFITLESIGYYIGVQHRAYWKAKSRDTMIGKEGLGEIEKRNKVLKEKLERLSPKGVYIVIDTANNTLYLKKGSNILWQALVSSGSGNVLEEPGGKRKWVFDTPRGEFEVKAKLKDPTWLKPDWSFIEEGEEIPKNIKERIEVGVLGDYALGFGDGYFIHGTLYTRLLGRNVTHGCIRVGDEDLKAIYRAAPIGTKIFIF